MIGLLIRLLFLGVMVAVVGGCSHTTRITYVPPFTVQFDVTLHPDAPVAATQPGTVTTVTTVSK